MPKNSTPKETKKMVIFIVEGKTDKTALEMIFRRLYSKQKEIRFEFMNGDITSNYENNITNVEAKVYEKVDECMKRYKLEKSDIFQVIQIFDTDGAYIPNEAIKQRLVNNFEYTTSNIFAADINKVIERNDRKRELMDFLVAKTAIKDIPYQGYFMSSNLDHALYNKQNLTDEEKIEYSSIFNANFEGKEKLFISFIKTDVANGVPDKYRASWQYIRTDLNSLQRHTNLHVYFLNNPILN